MPVNRIAPPTEKPASYHLDIYDCWLHLCITRRQWSRLRRKINSLPTKPGDAAGTVTQVQHTTPAGRHTQHHVIWIDMDAMHDVRDLIDTTAHEATHVATNILEHVGQPLANDEALAYLVGWVTGWLWESAHA